MANSPPTINVVQYATGGGVVGVFPLLPTQLLGSQDGSDVGTGGPATATRAPAVPAGTFNVNSNIEFLDDRYVLTSRGPGAVGATTGVYKKNQGGAGQWGRVRGGQSNGDLIVDGHHSGLHVLHPAGVPTLAYFMFDDSHELRISSTTDGTTGGSWVANQGSLLETNGSSPADIGQSIIFRNSIVWAHLNFTGGAGIGAISQFDLVLSTFTRYNVTGVLDQNNRGCSFALHLHDNVLFLAGWSTPGSARVTKLQGGSFVTVVTDSSQIAGGGADVFGFTGHPALFTDPTTGDLIFIQSGIRTSNSAARTQISRIQNATGGSPVLLDVSTTVMDSGEGADKYLEGGGSANRQRRWVVNVDTATDPVNTRTFLTTWIAGGSTETWEWKGIGAEMEAVAGLVGISDDFALPYNTVGGGHRSPRIAAVEMEGPHTEEAGGTKIFWRARGSAPIGVATFRGVDTEGAPDTVLPILAFTVESGSPATTPTISGNTIINITPDNGATLYSVRLVVGTAGSDIGEGDVGLIIPDFV